MKSIQILNNKQVFPLYPDKKSLSPKYSQATQLGIAVTEAVILNINHR